MNSGEGVGCGVSTGVGVGCNVGSDVGVGCSVGSDVGVGCSVGSDVETGVQVDIAPEVGALLSWAVGSLLWSRSHAESRATITKHSRTSNPGQWTIPGISMENLDVSIGA